MTDFHLLIADWYRQNKRALPWRETKDPYLIWISEIILQQTRVDQGISYYNKFQKNYPTVNNLASASEQEILNDWQGLGYYSRARNLHFTAKWISLNYNNVFPNTYSEIKTLKGIGDYTAAAIASFAFDLPHAVVDGNVYRVLSRYFNIDLAIDSTQGKKYFSDLAQSLIDKKDPATHNQAIMELGAMICKPNQPLCLECPISNSCLAIEKKTVDQRPVKSKKTSVRNRYFTFLIYSQNNQVILEKRNKKDIWQHLFQFPLIESDESLSNSELEKITHINPNHISTEIVHLLSHQRIHARFLHMDCIPEKLNPEWQLVNKNELESHPLPRLIDRYLDEKCTWNDYLILPKIPF